MGLFDGVKDKLADSTGKNQTGFEPSVCEGCPERGGGALKPCGLCSCPTIKNLGLDMAQMTPEGCPRAEAHRRASENAEEFR